MNSKIPGAVLLMTNAATRNGEMFGATENHKFKLFLVTHLITQLPNCCGFELELTEVAHMACAVQDNEAVLMHGTSRFLKPDRFAKMVRDQGALLLQLENKVSHVPHEKSSLLVCPKLR